MTSSHCDVLILSGQSDFLTSSSRISAAVPGNVDNPAAFRCSRNSLKEIPRVSAPCHTSNGEKACICSWGTAVLTVERISKYVWPV